ncbi:uncharacterized protein LOC114944552 isoform X2 [Nylanderia fulva]|uniref:uncharacterized protein LOC114944552 isoform X2 n=1 Tax=Nylanderia fulva TaxID=613905 RepID=UPI0010FB97A9|nr:uncharacterized protein LOC114944552 isoform X2 [Nylanderia fulva]
MVSYVKALEYLSSTFIMLKEQIKNFTSEVRQILHEILKRIKYEEIDDTDKLRIRLRQEAARWACFFDDITCKRVANNKLTQHLQDPAKYKLLPWWKEWTYCKGLMITTINNTTWELVYTKGLKKSDSKFLEYLTCSEDINLIKKNVSITAALITIINNVYSVNQTEEINKYVQRVKAEAFLLDKMRNTKYFRSFHLEKIYIGRISDKIESHISIRNRQIERLRKNFDNFFFWWKNFN